MSSANYIIIYDGNCNLCVNFTKLLERFDRGKLFRYIPMQNTAILETLNITPQDCEQGMILKNIEDNSLIWQGSEAAEKIIELLPNGQLFINAYRSIPNLKFIGDKSYLKIRDNRYQWFGGREKTYYSPYNLNCKNNSDCLVN
ncbi:DCC1-like thiol-disulfide oxidoreductase family protein [Cyanobacterium aponinum UTEX 3222]|uniref:thiol-disulfide oxidoreductase DCC family protein n=1 Tax=Cyanobacterium aponinum TaxID=379064 RepID=UPI002B4BE896|nr:DCC1-like thiol-disulfide oxidoreductase family protein [Cyanobacterium aponinum]WRL38611.1 DCC1-like thiol-disulfide oxidoreductase family protein [Cyanobacterium aponinum UTEX 3221]WRL42196.1 DCC1-like thiol-disulfide oxidoreductase family protein [Cyanobacterium aponinum UTEX 3222]